MWPFSPRQTRRTPATRCRRPAHRPLLEVLEDRLVLSGSPPAVLISGPAQVGESPYGPYTLNLTAVDPESDPVTEWTIDWGDGSVETLPGNPGLATHAYTNGPVVRNITASAVVGGEPFDAHVSGAGAFMDTFVQAGGGQQFLGFMTFGRDDTGDGVGDLHAASYDSSNVAVYSGQTGAYVRTLITAADGLDRPWGVAFGPDGNLYVSGQGSSNVLRYDFTTTTVSTFLPTGSVRRPDAIAFGPDGHLYVAQYTLITSSTEKVQILRFDGVTGQPSGVFVDQPPRVYDMEFRGGYLYAQTESLFMKFRWLFSSFSRT